MKPESSIDTFCPIWALFLFSGDILPPIGLKSVFERWSILTYCTFNVASVVTLF